MWVNGVEYQLVEQGAVETTFMLGVLIGILAIGSLVFLYVVGKRTLFKKYYMRLDAEKQKSIGIELQGMADDCDALANETNTVFFKTMANEFNSLLWELRKH